MRHRHAFTLVELLVVIGIIAVLVGILLPSLQAARKSARQTKCAAAMREIGTGFVLYANTYRGYFPPAQLTARSADSSSAPVVNNVYDLYGDRFPLSGTNAYWFNFLTPLLHKNSSLGVTSTTDAAATDARFTVFWGCTEWDGFASSTIGGVNRVQPGLGINMWPTFQTGGVPTTNFPPEPERNFVTMVPNGSGGYRVSTTLGRWAKQKDYGKDGSQRALVADSLFWLAEANPAPADGSRPTMKWTANTNPTYTAPNQTTVDLYRHGVKPQPHPTIPGTLSNQGGKIAYNVLFADGHVEQVGDFSVAYRSLRMRYPN